MSRNRQPNSGNSCIHKISWEHPTQFETAEHRQSESLEGYGIPSDSLLPICFTVDEAGLVLAVNPAGAASWGYRVEELDGQPIFNFFHPKDRATLQVEFATFVQHPEQEVRGKFCLLSKEGSKLAVKVTVQPLQYIDAKVVFLLTCEVCNNVTKRKRKQGELRLRKPIEETLRQNFDLRNRELLTLQRISEIHLPEALKQRLLELLEFAIEAGELETYEHELAQPDGVHTYEVRIVKSSVDEAVCIVRNITESKQAEEALQQQCIRERLVGAIAQRIHQSLDLEEILNTTVAEVRQFLHTDRVLIYRVWSDGTGSAVTEAVVPGLPTVMGRTFPEEVFPQESQHLYCQGRILAIEDIEQADVPPCLAEFVQQFGVKAKLVVPILQDEALWGLLIAHHCSSPRQWQPFEIDLLKS
ncbi:MAG: GAF domain-containing protein, partial [Coleofasciculus sp. S288]|nr:GAF domain-containing protein [Coleofasciculus sp. S288]